MIYHILWILGFSSVTAIFGPLVTRQQVKAPSIPSPLIMMKLWKQWSACLGGSFIGFASTPPRVLMKYREVIVLDSIQFPWKMECSLPGPRRPTPRTSAWPNSLLELRFAIHKLCIDSDEITIGTYNRNCLGQWRYLWHCDIYHVWITSTRRVLIIIMTSSNGNIFRVTLAHFYQ